ncbi:hypothetical protein [Pararhodobacter aggregans]|uniref:DUF2946 domain-containing protein n=1 Tax=Pararhodobacter aggregans TaxID=404875 RepID=A0A2T7UM39_9RHOB|nr:hypothetical protein [Pararhodobacter aggregans]PTW99971.1 hypothetical protein C8N33_11257 [Pararhodobacter aggregans]PVE45727.1 hypothetical protein DDE23_19675 [Pararhodobacter aggregans]
MRFLTLALAMLVLVANLATPLAPTAADIGCGGAIAALDHCPIPGVDPARANPAERFTAPCATCVLPGLTALPDFEPGQSPLTFAETARLVTMRAEGPPRRPPRPIS